MPKKEVFNLTIDVGANISQAQTAAKSLQQAFSKINLSDNLKNGLDKTFSNLEKELNSLSALTSKPFTSMKDIQKAEKSYDKINDLMAELVAQSKSIEGADLSKFIPTDALNKLKSFNIQLEQVRKNAQALESQKISIGKDLENARKKGSDLKDEIDQVTAKLQQAESSSDKSKTMQNRIEGYKVTLAGLNVELTQNAQKQKELNNELKKLENVKPEGLQQLRESLKEFTGDSLRQIPRTFESLQNYINNLQADEIEKIRENVKNLSPEAQQLAEAFGIVPQKIRETADEGQRLSETAAEVERLGNQVKQFFSIGNTIQLFKRAVRDAMNTVKELDATMTETATVTDFSISDMWEQLPRYTDEANKLGTSINSLYKATTLYYQQGLQTEEAMALGIETIKMARVANMDAALATDLMTAALRGFNMELNEMSAVRINDVYSELAAVTAADTDEIGIAISKTASIAHSANMEFETTAAFLSQIIETTREAPETAGTAMKTIIARFSEVKKLYSEGQILGTDEEGEAINVNKIQEALRTVGIDMTKFFVGAEGLDDVLLRLAQKWDTLDVATQRYIATQAAGSRQQSRFLAMMSDYDRTMELVDAAYDSAGSGQAQFEKTLDSMQAKLSELKNAWDQFVMGLANNEILKFGVDTLTKILSTINDIISAISGGSGLVKSVLSLGSAFLALRSGAKLFGSGDKAGLLGKFFGILKGKSAEKQAKEASQKVAQNFSKGFKDFISGGFDTEGLKESFKNKLTTSFNGIINTFSSKELDTTNIEKVFQTLFEDKDLSFDFDTQQKLLNIEGYRDQLDKLGFTVTEVNGKFQVFEKKGIRPIGIAFTALGSILTAFGDDLEKKGSSFGTFLKTIGTTITVIGSAITLLGGSFTKAGIEIGKAGAIAKLGWAEFVPILLAIVAIVGLVTAAINNTPEKRLERAKQKAQEAQQAAQEAQQAYDDLLSNKNKYTELEDKIKSLTKGTEEWKEAVAELNGDVLELAQNYKGIKFEYGEDGILQVTNWDEVIKQSKKERDDALYTSLQSSAQETDTELEIARNNQLYRDKRTGKVKKYSTIKNNIDSINSISNKQKENLLKEFEPIIDEVTTSAEAKAKNNSRNILLAFMPDAAISNKITDEISDSIVEAYDNAGKKVSDLTQDELKEVLKQSTILFSGFSEEVQNFLQGDFNEIDTAETFTFDENQITQIAEAWKLDEDAVRNYIAAQNEAFNLSQEATKEELVRVTGSQSRANFLFERYGTGLSKTLADTTSEMGEEDGFKYLNAFGKIFEKDKSLDKVFSKKIAGLKINNINDLVSITDMLRNEGYSEEDINAYWEACVKGANNFSLSLKDIANRADSLSEVYKSIDEITKRMEEGSLTGEDIAYLEGLGVDLSGLQRTADGWRLIGDEAERAIAIMREQPLAQEQATVDYLDKIKQQGPEMMAKYLGLSMDDFLDPGEFYAEVQKRFAEIYNMATQNEAFSEASKLTADENALQGGSAESVRYSAENEAKAAGLDRNELIAYSEKLQETYGLEQAVADRIALDNMKMNASIKELSSNWNEWKAGLEGGKDTDEYSAALDNLRRNIQSMLGITSNLSEDFLTNADTMNLMARAAEGDAEAIDELRKAASKDIALSLGIDESTASEIQNVVSDFMDSADYENLKIGAEFDNSSLEASFQEMLESGALTVEQMNTILEGIGWQPEITYAEMPLSEVESFTGKQTNDVLIPDGEGGYTTQTITQTQDGEIEGDQKVRVPILGNQAVQAKAKGYDVGTMASFKGKGGSTVNPSNRGSGKGKGGGGGGSKKQNNWKNPYDKYYNLTEKINEALRTREKIERDYDRILKRRERTVAELLANSQAEVEKLQEEIQYQKQLQAGRLDQLKNVASEKYDDDGTLRTFKDMGVTKYAKYNFDTQTVEIDYEAIDKVRDERLGKAIEAYEQRLLELAGQFEETQTTIEEMENQVWEINQRGKTDYLEFEAKTIKALINVQQKIIDDLSAKFESINEANDNILNSMQEQIDLERQIRDNTKTEDDIAQKEARLAYLRRDTSGANATEIMQLEQDLADARQNYTDTLIDQGMQKLSDENQKAAEQRQQQIDIMQAQLDWTAESGGFNQKAQELIEAAAKTGLTGSELERLLQEDEGWAAMTTFAQTNWTEEFTESFKAAMEGLGNFKVDQAKQENTSAANPLKNILDASGKNAANIWWDSSKGQWVDKDGNEYDIAWNPELNEGQGGYYYSNKRTPKKAEKPKSDTPKTDPTPKPDPPKKEPDKKSSTASTDHGYTIKKGDGSKLTKGGYASKSKASDAAQGKIDKQIKDAEQSVNQAAISLAKGQISQSAYKNTVDFLDNWKKATYTAYKTGGLNTQTGLAWLDGTTSHPELVLNARDTENFIQLKDILSSMGSLDKLQNGGDNYYNFDIKVDQLANDYDVDKLIGKIKNEIDKDARYRNVNSINFIR